MSTYKMQIRTLVICSMSKSTVCNTTMQPFKSHTKVELWQKKRWNLCIFYSISLLGTISLNQYCELHDCISHLWMMPCVRNHLVGYGPYCMIRKIWKYVDLEVYFTHWIFKTFFSSDSKDRSQIANGLFQVKSALPP